MVYNNKKKITLASKFEIVKILRDGQNAEVILVGCTEILTSRSYGPLFYFL